MRRRGLLALVRMMKPLKERFPKIDDPAPSRVTGPHAAGQHFRWTSRPMKVLIDLENRETVNMVLDKDPGKAIENICTLIVLRYVRPHPS
jgi:hypothetical protein